MNEKEFAELAAGYALRALSPEDEKAFEIARRQHPEWEHHVTADATAAALLAETTGEVAPPPGIREALLAQIADPPSPGQPAPKKRRWRGRHWFALAASFALLAGAGGVAVFVSQQVAAPASVVALNEIEAAPDAQAETVPIAGGGEATAHWSETVGKVVLVSQGLPPITDDNSYELWFVRDGTPISAGVFAADDGEATALLSGAMESGDVIAVTVEPAGGSPTGQPTSDPIVAIETA